MQQMSTLSKGDYGADLTTERVGAEGGELDAPFSGFAEMLAVGEVELDASPNGNDLRPVWMSSDARGVQATICAYSWPCDWAVAVIGCETGGTYDAYSHGHEEYQGHYWHFLGWWQIAVPNHTGNNWLYDPVLNTVEAHIKYVSGGIGHWPNCP